MDTHLKSENKLQLSVRDNVNTCSSVWSQPITYFTMITYYHDSQILQYPYLSINLLLSSLSPSIPPSLPPSLSPPPSLSLPPPPSPSLSLSPPLFLLISYYHAHSSPSISLSVTFLCLYYIFAVLLITH